MPLCESFERVLELQESYSASKTALMDERLKLVHDAIPTALRDLKGELATLLSIEEDQLMIHGKAGMGQNNEIPWIRIADKKRSPSARHDWYVVILFAADGSRCWVQICRSSTTWNGQTFTNIELDDLKSDCKLLRRQLESLVPDGWEESVQLKSTRSDLGVAYEAACALGVSYQKGGVPNDPKIIGDILRLTSLLANVYALRPTSLEGVTIEPEVAIAVQLADEAAKPKVGGGQGFGLTAEQRKAVEQRAVDVAINHLKSLGALWITDVGATQSYDLDCSISGQKLFVEVKGSTSAGGAVILTKNEVEFHRKHYPNNALAVVSGISLDKEQVLATGGELHWVAPWSLSPDDLQPLSYVYKTGL